MKTTKKKAALYSRVSTLEQVKTGYSLSVQEEKLRAYAAYQSYEVIEPPYTDDGYTGANIHRPALAKLIEDVKSGRINIVLIYRLDRLSRRVKDVLELVELFEKYKVSLYSLHENIDLSSPFGRAALKMSATFSELERETIVERTTMGKDKKIRLGHKMFTRFAPFGYKYDRAKKAFDIVDDEAEIVRDLFDKYIKGCTSFRKLYDYAKDKYDHPYFNNTMCCKPIIKRAMYAGYVDYKGELYKGENFEAIIDYETYLKAQRQVEKNKAVRSRETTPYLLTGLIVCAKCGNRYVGKLSKRPEIKRGKPTETTYQYTTYGCADRLKHNKKYSTSIRCSNAILRAVDLEAQIENSIMSLDFDTFDGESSYSGVIDRLMAESAAAKKQIDKLLDLYMSDLIDKETYQARIADYEKTIRKNKEVIEAESQKLYAKPADTIDFLKARQAEYKTANKKEKRAILALLIDYIAIDGESVNIKYRVKSGKEPK